MSVPDRAEQSGQRSAITAFGRRAATDSDPDALLGEAAITVAETLDAHACAIIELRPGAETGVLREGVSRGIELADDATVPVDEDESLGRALRGESPVAFESDGNGLEPGPVADADVGSGVSAVVGDGREPWGVLETYASDRRGFSDLDVSFVESIADVLGAAIRRVEPDRGESTPTAGRERQLETEREAVFERITDAFYAVDDEWRFTYVNNRAEDVLGVPADELLGESLWEVFPDAVGTDIESRFREAMETGESASFERYSESLEMFEEVRVYPSETGLSVYFRDVTERERTRRRLEEERDMFAEGPAVVFRWRNEEGWPVEYVSENVTDAFGYEPTELESGDVPYTDLLLEEDVDRIAAEVEAEADDATDRFSHEPYRVRTADGDVRWVKDTTKILRNEDGEITHYLGYLVDVTERKEHERELAAYETVVETINDGIYVVDDDGRFTMVNEAYTEMLGYEREDLLGAHVSQVVSEETVRRAREMEAAMRDGEAEQPAIEAELATADGDSLTSEATFALLPPEDGIERRIGVARDVTERKERERELERYERIVGNLPVGVYRNTPGPDGEFVEMNERLAEIFDADSTAELSEYNISDLYADPEQRREFSRRLEREGRVTDVELRQTTLDGRTIWISVTAIRTEEDGEVYFDGIVQNVTERKERQRELERYETLFTESRDVNAVVDADGTFQYLPPSTENVLGYEPADLRGEDAFEYVHPDDRERVQEVFGALVADPEADPTIEFRLRRADGEWIVLQAHGRNLLDDPDIGGIVTYTRDVTEQRETERELRKKERRYEAVFEDPNILVGLLEPDGTVLDVNDTAMEYIDADLADVTGDPFWETPWWGEGDGIQPEVREWTERAADGEYVDFEADLTRPDGERYTLSGYFRPVTNEDGEVVSIIVSDRDITERRERERELEESRQRYRTLVENFPNGAVALVDEDLRYQTVGGTPVGERTDSAADLEGAHVREAVSSELADEIEPRYRAALDGEASRFETEHGGRYSQFQVLPVRDDDGEVFAAIGMSQDVTERRERERELEESERRYRALAEYFPNGIVTLFDRNFRYTLAAGQGFEKIPLDPDDLEGEPLDEVWDDETADALQPAFLAALAGEEESVEVSYEGREWLVHAVPITDERGEVFAGMTMAQDVTEQKERERYLEDAKSRLEAATEAGALGTWEWHVRDDEMVTGPLFAETFGIDPDAASEGVSLDRFVSAIHEDDRERVEAEIEAALESCGEYEAEYRVRNADDEVRWVVARGRVECDEDGEPVRFLGALTDITERKRAELELERNKEQLETLFEVLPVGALVAEADGEIVEANDVAGDIWGGDVFDADSIAEYEKFPIWWADSGERADPDEITLSRVLDGEAVTDPDVFEIESFDGEHRIVRAEGVPIRDESGEVVRGVTTLTDVTERRESQRKLEESEHRYRTLVENFPDGAVGLFDEDLRYTAVGGQFLGDVGIDEEERLGNSVHEIYPDALVEEVEPYFRAALEGEANSFEVEFHDRHLLAHTLPVRDADEEVFAGMLVVQDVTDRVERERQLEEVVERLEESNERLEQFAYAASHDLQEPLRMVSSYLRLIENRYRDDLDEEGREFLEFAVDGADRMRDMIDGLLEYSRVDTRGDPFEPVDLETVLADVRRDLEVKIEEADAEITAGELPRIEGDGDQLRQVFQNLLDNAIEYSGDDAPRIHVDARPNEDGRPVEVPDSEAGEWVVSISDEGIGIDPDDAERVFDVFQRLHAPDEHEGTGIGLALCERIVERHGGDIWIESESGEGATVFFTLPVRGDVDE